MTLRTRYCLPIDVMRKLDPTFTASALDNDAFFDTNDDRDIIYSTIENWEAELDNRLPTAFRERIVGADADTYPVKSAETMEAAFNNVYQGRRTKYLAVNIGHLHIQSFDSNEGDVFEVRDGIDSWRSHLDDEYRLKNRTGMLYIPLGKVYLKRQNDRRGGRGTISGNIEDVVRLRYRYGNLGGHPERGGETTVASTVNQGDSTIEVDDATKLPGRGVLLLGGTDPEYVSFNGKNNSTLQNVVRGTRGTSDVSHSSGDTVHYCPGEIREAVAARVAVEFVRSDDWSLVLDNGAGGELTSESKMQSLRDDWNEVVAKYQAPRFV